ncbi:hypothetical protein HYPSUDRAFT_191202 [Hypholoma sublateritium FD-334 SS-4]|uniref:DNA endonuclease activator Ctp1 C-terminal domain-containing protein n=1 Tax=Hypholoma sublateritium (strain FD-334 SS-4) TaxID=945553 RepID=A0A0D2M545_HYPSF|nr:hypothetical protein HYPSUDRAFT_191202 [Hypholoma sublateritium FD-334 SS-4]
MNSEKPTYSSTALRARDKRILDKHEKDTNALVRRHDFRQGAATMSMFDMEHRCQRIADLLGYTSISEAITEIETANIGATFRQCIHRLEVAEAGLEVEKTDNQTYRIRVKNMEKSQQKHEHEHRKLDRAYRQLEAEKKDLEVRYDHLADIRRRADERYRADYKKWKAVYVWLTSDGPDEDHPDVSFEDKKQLSKINPIIARKRQAIIDGSINLSFVNNNPDDFPTPKNRPPPLGGIEMQCDEEDDKAATPPHKKRRLFNPSPLSSSILKSVMNTVDTSRSSTVVPTPSHVNDLRAEQKQTPTKTKPSKSRIHTPVASQYIPNSSDTEEDTQPIWVPLKKQAEQRSASKMPPPPPVASSSKISNLHSSPRKVRTTLSPGRKGPRTSLAEAAREVRMSPSKHRRHSDHERPLGDILCLRKGKERQNANKENANDVIDEYSVFKGRGRYGKQKEPENTSINAMYAIDPANNGGLDYQYDEVVRSRDARKKMHAGDCECCKAYYEAVGPLPTRLKQPLWRSPTSSPTKTAGASHRQADIDSHKKAISRHRHTWARAPTPPGYWDIGFPNTQEVSVINAKAADMHKRKREEVDSEAARGGRYRRKS